MKIAYIVSLKYGMAYFIYKQIEKLIENGEEIGIFPTKYTKGIYYPKKEWKTYYWNPISVLFNQLTSFLKSPIKYTLLLFESFVSKSIIDLIFAWNFSNHMRNYDLIHSTMGDHKLFIGYWCKRILNKPLIVTLRGTDLYCPNNEKMFVKALGGCDLIICHTNHMKDFLKEKYGFDSIVHHEGVPSDFFKKDNKIKILLVSRIVDNKGHDILLQAVKNLKNVEIWFVGTGHYEDKIKNLVKDLKLEDRVLFFGEQPDIIVRRLYNECDIFCLPTFIEGLPAVLQEAMSCEVPIITTKVTGIPELVKQGILVNPGSVAEVRKAIIKLMKNKNLRRTLGKRGRKIILEEFDLDKNTKKLIHIYKRFK
ncbi:MAG: glycosyltransferase family 4 protein [Candidatus Aenigmatarchaeota archaeon]